MNNLNPVEGIASLIVQGIVVGIVLAIAVPVSRLIMKAEFKGYAKIKKLVSKKETICSDS